ncbi:MAG: AbrB/MazE/SpoVT family DNA-binding domain-containing protein [Nitrospiraceae bacterium]|nr:AbrB/MazE/SpoVT family DNA-binding domain-containing protein [Nitrospiraceae bacterium]
MHRKVCSIGNSRGVSIPADVLSKLDLAVGSEVDVRIDEAESKIIIEPVRKKKYPKGVDREFVSQVNDFIARYEPALKELAKK